MDVATTLLDICAKLGTMFAGSYCAYRWGGQWAGLTIWCVMLYQYIRD